MYDFGEDVKAILQGGVFSQDIIFNGVKTIKGIFDKDDTELDPQTAELLRTGPAVFVDPDDVTGIKDRDTFLIEGITYNVQGTPNTDNGGLMRVILDE